MSSKINLRKLTTRIVNGVNMSEGRKHLRVEYEKEVSTTAGGKLKAEAANQVKSRVLHSANVSAKKNKFMPKNYEEVMVNIREMRQLHPAPVDSMGCEKCHDGECRRRNLIGTLK